MEQKDRWDYLKKEYKGQEIIEETEDFEEPKEMTEEEKQQVKKQMMFLVWLIIIILFGVVVFAVVSKIFDKKEKTQDVPIEENLKEPLPDGDIDITNELLKEIDSMYKFNVSNPLYEENILKLFSGDKVEINNLDFQTKMLLVTSHTIFNEYMLNGAKLNQYQKTQVSITKAKLEELVEQILGPDIDLDHDDFKYYYYDGDKIVCFDVVLNKEKYLFVESEYEKSKISVHKKMISANKIGDEVYIKYKYIFVNENGVYADPKFKTLITPNTSKINDSLVYGKGYTHMYIINSEEYNLAYVETSEFGTSKGGN